MKHLLVFLVLFGTVFCEITDVRIHDDLRPYLYVSHFGYEANGRLLLHLETMKLEGDVMANEPNKLGFIVKRTDIMKLGLDKWGASFDEELDKTAPKTCYIRENLDADDIFFDVIALPDYATVSDSTYDWLSKTSLIVHERVTYEITIPKDGMYTVFFVNCYSAPASFGLTITMFNTNGRYLSVGLENLPTMLMWFSLLFFLGLVVWIKQIYQTTYPVHKIHHLMTLLLFIKSCSLLALALRYREIARTGDTSGWDTVYLVFTFLKSVMMFLMIALVGTGWSILKPYLNEQDTRILMFVLPMQIFANIGLVLYEQTSPTHLDWWTWGSVLRLVDLICCGAVLFPVIWNIRNLRASSKTDGKAELSMQYEILFRKYYSSVVIYIYMTRIFVYLIEAMSNYRNLWTATFFEEAISFIFYVYIGYQFRPEATSPFLESHELHRQAAAGESPRSAEQNNV